MNEISIKNFMKNGIFFLLLVALTFFILLKDSNINDIFIALNLVRLPFVLAAICCVFVFVCCEAINIKRILKVLYYDIRFIDCLKYAFIGFFFSSVTPSASGGQPMQVYYMKKDRIEISHSSLALLVEFACYQLVTISMAVIAFILNYKLILSINHSLKLLLIVGVLINTCVLIFIFFGIFSKRISVKIIDFFIALIYSLKIKKAEELKKKAYEQLEKYQEGAAFIKQNKKIMLKMILTTILQITSIHSVTFLIYKAFGLFNFSYLTVLSLQAILYISVSAIPLPGAVGVSENGFLTLFNTLFPQKLLSSAMLLSRGISFYLFVVISGIAVMLAQKKLIIAKLKENSKQI